MILSKCGTQHIYLSIHFLMIEMSLQARVPEGGEGSLHCL